MTTSQLRASAANHNLTKALIDAAAQGLRSHCSDPGTGGMWLSEEPADRREAAKLCRHCPVFGACGSAVNANGEKFGVWAGQDFSRYPRPRRLV